MDVIRAFARDAAKGSIRLPGEAAWHMWKFGGHDIMVDPSGYSGVTPN